MVTLLFQKATISFDPVTCAHLSSEAASLRVSPVYLLNQKRPTRGLFSWHHSDYREGRREGGREGGREGERERGREGGAQPTYAELSTIRHSTTEVKASK